MKRILRACASGGAAVALALTVAGCGGTVADPGTEQQGASGEGVTVQSARGPVTLPAPAKRVVSLELTYTEELLALGVPPVGNADNDTYNTWVSAPGTELPPEVTDVGSRSEPSLEQIKALQPDLIVAPEDRVGANYEALQEIAPVVSLDYTAKPQLETMKKNFTELGKATGKQDKSTQVLGQLDTKIAETRTKLEAAGKAGAPYAIGQAPTADPSIRLLGDDSMVAQVLNAAGLKNTWQGQPDEWGMTTVGVEALTQIPDNATFMYVASKKSDPFKGAIAANPVWQNLPFVQQDRAKALDPGTWFFGGPLSAMQLLDETAKAMQVR
ncbi:ABC transporter substrate-binding protein [Allosaccharopolyspora coralli]|uniref:ABC transporter substrate-binding protein n=1 Tax=Allosaccharopolyspora coralli TaxID=2665642 RepID=A0A5Q3QG84_9PSEU|nr:iron-siderophore ABC transporter substrate-binding protein [Allosaccharopolyspora coralli]QGK70545.1 ABC transporter substrate-binding protein [Allosaccharopolyspora coralli]